MTKDRLMLHRIPLLLVLAATPALAAGPFQDLSLIDRGVARFTGRAVGEEGGARTPVDARLKLAPCPMVSMAWRDAHDAVVVTCTGPDWRLFVPVRGAVAPPKAAAPLVAAPFLGAPQAAIERPVIVIKRGDPVTVAAGSPGFSITREGIAASDAGIGARFLVKVDPARPPIQAIALGQGRATLPGWAE